LWKRNINNKVLLASLRKLTNPKAASEFLFFPSTDYFNGQPPLDKGKIHQGVNTLSLAAFERLN
jgi:hypothetical protein